VFVVDTISSRKQVPALPLRRAHSIAHTLRLISGQYVSQPFKESLSFGSGRVHSRVQHLDHHTADRATMVMDSI